MNRSVRAQESKMQAPVIHEGPQQRRNFGTVMKETEDELALFLETRKREKERDKLLLLHNSEEFEAPLGSKPSNSSIFKIVSSMPAHKTGGADDFLNSGNDKNDYEWLLTPPGTPLFPSLEMESEKAIMSQIGTPKPHPTVPKSRMDPASKDSLISRQSTLSPRLKSSSPGTRKSSLSGGPGSTASRPATPTGCHTVSATAKSSRTSTPTSQTTLPSSNKLMAPSARSSTPTTRPSVPVSKITSRSATPKHRSSTPASVPSMSAPPEVLKSVSTTSKNPVVSHGSSPTVKSRPLKPSETPGFSRNCPPNLRTSMPEKPVSASRGRPGAPSARSYSVEAVSNGRSRRQSTSPSRGRAPNGSIHSSGGSVPAVSRAHSNGSSNVNPVLIGTKMVERLVNMRKLAPPKQDDQHFTHNNPGGKSSSSSDSSGFGRNLSKKSLDMALRHMDIRRNIPGSLRPSMTNIPASSMYSVRSGPARSRIVSVSDSPLAMSSNASTEQTLDNNVLYFNGTKLEDSVCGSERGSPSSPATQHDR